MHRLKRTIKNPAIAQVASVSSNSRQPEGSSWPAGLAHVLLGAEESCMKSESVELQAMSQSTPHPGSGKSCRDNCNYKLKKSWISSSVVQHIAKRQNVWTSSEGQQCTIVLLFFPQNTLRKLTPPWPSPNDLENIYIWAANTVPRGKDILALVRHFCSDLNSLKGFHLFPVMNNFSW